LLEIDAMVKTDLLKRALTCSEAAVCSQIRAKAAMNRVETDRLLIDFLWWIGFLKRYYYYI
jgi:hypothetical protein